MENKAFPEFLNKKVLLSQNVTVMSSFCFEFKGNGKNKSKNGFYSEGKKNAQARAFWKEH
ncbi:hypothetical protein [Thiomicrospira sp. XS5]|uniref:hypothetical protein n=1 Tax=Thiomicrospira sp. XS5 TaxID=1775636 RepID=UPI00128F6D4C|nr:hypothetical protein [Thiomicrospira sp. XS5]